MDIKEKLEQSIKSGEIIGIIYLGGSNPGKSRKVVPVRLDGDRLIARCLSSNKVKSFIISKIVIQENGISFGADSSSHELDNQLILKILIRLYTSIKMSLKIWDGLSLMKIILICHCILSLKMENLENLQMFLFHIPSIQRK